MAQHRAEIRQNFAILTNSILDKPHGKIYLSSADLTSTEINLVAQLATNNPTVEIIHNTYKPVKEQKRKAFISSNLNVVMGELIHQVRRLKNNKKILICTDSQKLSGNKSSHTLESFTDVVDILDSLGILPNGFEIDPITREIIEKARSKKQKTKLRVMGIDATTIVDLLQKFSENNVFPVFSCCE